MRQDALDRDLLAKALEPGATGAPAAKQFAGSIKRPGAVDEITPHLRGLVGR